MTQLLEKQRAERDIGFGALAVIVVAAASVAGQLATYPNLELGMQGSPNLLSIRQTGFLLRFGQRFSY
jgi:hypothetical protein